MTDYDHFIASLSDNELTTLIFRDFGYTYTEIAGFMGVYRPSVNRICERIKVKARRWLEDVA